MDRVADVAHIVGKTNNGLVAWQSTLAFLQYVAAAGVLTELLSARFAGLALVIVGGLTQATGVWVAAMKPVQTLPHTGTSPPGVG